MSTKISTRVYFIWLAGIVGLILVFTLLLNFSPVAADGPPAPLTEDEHPAEANASNDFGSSDAGGDFLVSIAADTQEYPAIAYNSDSDEYLVVWEDERHGEKDLFGQILSAQGIPQGENFPISTAADDQENPVVVYNTTDDEFLVVWDDSRSTWRDIYGQRVGADGSLKGGEIAIITATDTDTQQSPAVAYSPAAGGYLVVWDDLRNASPDTIAQRVNADGSLEGDTIPISTSSNSYSPVIAYNAKTNQYLIVWEQGGAGTSDIYGQLVNDDGTIVGANFPIVSTAGDQKNPSLAYHTISGEMLVVWEDYRDELTRGADIYGQRVDSHGSLSGNYFAISIADSNQCYPVVSFNANQRQYLVVWRDERNLSGVLWDIYGQRVGSDGTLASQGDFVISSGVAPAYSPTVAFSTYTNQYLVVWSDTRTGHVDVFGQRVWWPGLLVGYNFSVSAACVSQDSPSVAFNGIDGDFLIVWADERNGNADIYGQRLDLDGTPRGGNFVIYDGPNDQRHPDVAYNTFDNNFLVVWETEVDGDIEGVLVSNHGSPIAGSFYEISADTGVNDRTRSHPSVAYSINHHVYLVVFEYLNLSGAKDIYGVDVSFTGRPITDEFAIATHTVANQRYPDVVYNRNADEFLVVWQDLRVGHDNIYGRKVGFQGTMPGSEFVISDAPGSQQFPSVSYNTDDNEYLVVWHDDRNAATNGYDIYGQRVGVTSNLLGDNFAISTVEGVSNQQHPDVVYVLLGNRYRVVWQDDREGANGWDIRGQWVSKAGAALGVFDDPIFRYPGWQEYPVIAYGSFEEGVNALTVWQDRRNGVDTDIYGRLGALDGMPPRARFNYGPSVGFAGSTFTFNAWPSWDDHTPRGALLVRWDFDNDGVWNTPLSIQKFVTQTLDTPGIYTVTLEVWDMAWFTDTETHNIIVLPNIGGAYPQPSFVVSPTHSTVGAPFLFDGDGSSDGSPSQKGLTVRWDWENDGQWDTGFGAVLTATHAYTVTGDYTVRFEVKGDNGSTKAALRNVSVAPGAIVDLSLCLHDITIPVGESVQFHAKGMDAYGNVVYDPIVIWSVTNPAAGLIDATGVFTASCTVGTYPNVVSVASGAISDTATVTIFWPYQIYLPLVVR